jgi:membrane protease YdiL (CAAX protease family)
MDGSPQRQPPPASSSRAAIDVPWGREQALWGVAGLAAAAAVAAGVFGVLSLLSDARGTPSWVVSLSTLVLQTGMLAVAFRLGPYRRGGPPGVLLGVRRLDTRALFGWGAVAFFGSVAASLAYAAVAGLISDALVPPPLPLQLDVNDWRLLAFATIVIGAPMAEETFFRGFLFAGFLRRYGFWGAAVISAGLFAATHLDVALLGPAFLSGLVFAAIYRRTGSVWPVILAHTAQNAIAFGLAT